MALLHDWPKTKDKGGSVQGGIASQVLGWFVDGRYRDLWRTTLTWTLIGFAPILVVATYYVLQPIEGNRSSLEAVLFLDLCYVLIAVLLVSRRVARSLAARRAQSAGSRLHIRLTAVFSTVALLPTVVVAGFAVVTVNQALEGWFSNRVRDAIGASVAAAEAYQEAQLRDLAKDAVALAVTLDREKLRRGLDDNALRQALTDIQPQVQRGIKEAFVIDRAGTMIMRGTGSYLFNFDQVDEQVLADAAGGEPALVRDLAQNEIRAVVKLSAFDDRYIYISRAVDGDLLLLLDETATTAAFYQQLEQDRGRRLFDFGLLYFAFAVIMILAAIWLGLWFAERLSRPIGALAAAAQRVGAGDLGARVEAIDGDDEIAMLGRYFNQMTHQLQEQRDDLVSNAQQSERRRRLFDSVLSSVTSGVVGLDRHGFVMFVNRSAQRALAIGVDRQTAQLADIVPEFSPLFEELRNGTRGLAQGEVKLVRGGKMENLLVRIAERRNEKNKREGYVIAFEDVTDLVSAQRMAAWGDVARRIAHEIKNPLTPIQLSAERIKRKFSPKLAEESDQLENMTDVIIRQTNDLRRIVDEFSKFARMPEPQKNDHDVALILKDAVTLQGAGMAEISINCELPENPAIAHIDSTMISQALINLIKNAGEAIAAKGNTLADGEIRINCVTTASHIEITIADNGIGLPEDRARLFEPYVTHRAEGTGLGLSIVLKIIEEHGGTLELLDAPPFKDGAETGALALVRLPKVQKESDRDR